MGHHPREAGLLSLRVLYCAFSWHVAGRQLGEPALMRAEGGLTRLQVGAPESRVGAAGGSWRRSAADLSSGSAPALVAGWCA
eukprot:COSAG06_NODE_2545_length_6700_cov_12.854416_6_plen_82_part_00